MGELVSLSEFCNKRATKLRARYHDLMDKAEDFENRGLHAFKDAIVKSIIENNKECRKYGVSKWEAPVPMGDLNNRTRVIVTPSETADYLVIDMKIFPDTDCYMP
jgi:hypothetical protein